VWAVIEEWVALGSPFQRQAKGFDVGWVFSFWACLPVVKSGYVISFPKGQMAEG